MADRELIAAILTAGMLPTLEIPQSRTRDRSGSVTRAEGEAIQNAVDHAFGGYSAKIKARQQSMAEPHDRAAYQQQNHA